jgi:hypothetical protein
MGEGRLGAAPPEFAAYRDGTRLFSSIAGYKLDSFDITGGETPEHLTGYRATASLFPTLGIRPLAGRTFTVREELPGAPNVVVLGYRFWKRRYAEDRSILGTTIQLNERPYHVIGIMPPGFTFPSTAATPGEPPALWTPLSFTAHQLADWASSFDTGIVARLRGGVSVSQADGDVKRVAAQFQREHPDIYSGKYNARGNRRSLVARFQRTRSEGARHVVRCGCIRAGHRVLKRREPTAGTSGSPPARDVNPASFGSEPAAADTPGLDGKRGNDDRRQHVGVRTGVGPAPHHRRPFGP